MRMTNFMLLISVLVTFTLLLAVVHSAPHGVDFLGQGSGVVEGFSLALPQHEFDAETYYLYITTWGPDVPIRRVQPTDIDCEYLFATPPEPQAEVFASLKFAIPSQQQTATTTFTTTCSWSTVGELAGATHAHIMVSKVQLSWDNLSEDLTSGGDVYTAVSQWAPPLPSDDATGFVMTTPLASETPIPLIDGEVLPILTTWNGTWAHIEYSPHPSHLHIPQQKSLRFESSKSVLSAPLFQCFAVIYTANSGIVLRKLATRESQLIDDDFFYHPMVRIQPDAQDSVVLSDAYAYNFHCYAGIRPLATGSRMDLTTELMYSNEIGEAAKHTDQLVDIPLPTPSHFTVENTYTSTTIPLDIPTYFANDQACAPGYVFTSPMTLYPGEAFVFGATNGLVNWLNVTAQCKFHNLPYLTDVFTSTYNPAVGVTLSYTPTAAGWPQNTKGVPKRAVYIPAGTSIYCDWQWMDPFGDQNYPPAVPLAHKSLYMFFQMANYQHITTVTTATLANIFDVSTMPIYSRWDTKQLYTEQPPVLSVVVDLGGFIGHLSHANEYTILTFSTRAPALGNDPNNSTAVLDWTIPLSDFPLLGQDVDYQGLTAEYQHQQYSAFLNVSFSFHLSTPYNPAVNNGRDVRRFQVGMMFRGGLGEQGGLGFGDVVITMATPSGAVLKYIPPRPALMTMSLLPKQGDIVDPPRNHSLPMMTYIDPPTTLLSMGSAVNFDVKWVLDRDCFYYGDAVQFGTQDYCLDQIKCDGKSTGLFNNVIRLTADQNKPIQCPTPSQPVALEMQCSAIVRSYLHGENIPTQCRMGVSIAAQRFSGISIDGGQWGAVTQSVDALSLPGVRTNSYSWLCQHPHTFAFYPCDAVELETVKDYPCATENGQVDDCHCVYSFQPQCLNQQHQLGPDVRIRGTSAEPINVDEYCDMLVKPQPRNITVNYLATHCAACRKQTDTLYQWGQTCDIAPQIMNFTYAPRGSTADPTNPTQMATFDVTYSDIIELQWVYSGSPVSQITIYAQSTAFSPFKTLTIATLPVAHGVIDTTPVVIDKPMRYHFALEKLPHNGEIQDLIFFIVIGQAITTFTSTPTPQQPMLHVYPRCLKANGDSMCQNARVGTDGCNRVTGVCECDKSSVWQRGDYCELSICPTLQCVVGHTLPEVCTIVNTTSSSPSASPTFTPQCACDTTRYGGARCEVTLQCQDFFTSTSCPAPKGFPSLIDNTTTTTTTATADSCECACNGHWGTPYSLATTFCSTCQRRCLNGGVDYMSYNW